MVKSAKQKASRRQAQSGRSKLAKRRLTLEGLEARQLLAGGLGTGGSDVGLRTFTQARNVGSVPAFQAREAETLGSVGTNDTKLTAEFLPLGTGAGDESTIDLTGSLSLVDVNQRIPEDVDWFSFDLDAGDILDISVVGGVGEFDVFFESALPYQRGDFWFAGNVNFAGGGPVTTPYPFNSPLQTVGTSLGAQVVPESGRYFLRMAPNGFSGNYTVGLRTYRPVLESEPIGTQQKLFLDFDGAIYSRSELTPVDPVTGLPTTGTARLSPLAAFLDEWQILPEDEDRIIDAIIANMEENFLESLPLSANNGSFADTGVPGEFGIEILNSRDHADPYGQPNVSRVIIGGTAEEAGIDTIGLASSIDVGNFNTSESSFVLLDGILDFIDPIPRAGGVSRVEQFATFIGNVTAHEAGHFFGGWHQDNANARLSLMDQGGDLEAFTEVGLDGIFGTADDQDIDFVWDVFSPVEGIMVGAQDVANTIAFGLSTGKIGASVTGFAFNDANANGQSTGDSGLAGVTVFNDVNNNGLLDTNEQSTLSEADGSFTLQVAPGPATIAVVTPAASVATTPTSQIVTAGQAAAIQFGFNRIQSDITGTKFADLNGNGFMDAGEPGIGGVFIYLDLDGDDRPDIGEPRTMTAADGSYSIDFPGPGNYVIREVVEPGFLQTLPGPAGNFEHAVTFNGSVLNGNFNFGNLPARDYGDAPLGYPVTSSENGPSHGIVDGLFLGASVDRELDGTHSAGANFDDLNGVLQIDGTVRDDEDGVRLLSPLAADATAQVEVTATNNTGAPAFLQGWIDFNRDDDFNDPGEHILINRQLANGPQVLEIEVPPSATPGEVVARFRYSNSSGLTPVGPADSGEVEDYIFNVQISPEVVNPDEFSVPRNSVANPLDVLANDFELPGAPLEIVRLAGPTPRGLVQIADGGRSLLYTPPNGFIGLDQFSYIVRNTVTGVEVARPGNVGVTVTFQTAVPIAVDDTFSVPQNVVNQPLEVLNNDVASINGGLRIGSFSQGSEGGRIDLVGGGQSLIYNPRAGFAGTEQFNYTVVDSRGQSSMATVTVKMLPGLQDESVAFSFAITDPNDNVAIDNVRVGDEFLLTVSVEDLRNLPLQQREGVASAFLDLLYTDELVSTVPVSGATNGFPFDISFGPLFTGASNVFQTGDAGTPGLLNEIGGTQPVGAEVDHVGPAELFTVRLKASAEGVAVFQADPSDLAVSEVLVLGSDVAVPFNLQQFGKAELVIRSQVGGTPTKAVDDSFPNSQDSFGQLILPGQDARFRLFDNDLLGATGVIAERGLVTAPTRGNIVIDDRGTDTLNDDIFVYRADAGTTGVDSFRYLIVTADGFRSTAEVTLTVGAAAADDIVAIDFEFVDLNGNPIVGPLNVGDEFGVQVLLDDLRSPLQTSVQGVFAGFLDILYDRGLAVPTNALGTDFGFDVIFGPLFNEQAAVGVGSTPGLINEFGTLQLDTQGTANPLGGEPTLMATLFFEAIGPGNLRFVGDPADFSPFQDTLLFDPPGPVSISQIRYDVESIDITIPTGESARQNGLNPYDVNGDGYVSAVDALGVINTLNRLSRNVSGESAANITVFADVDGDSEITPFDALQVINALGRQARASRGQGESAPPISSPTTDLSTASTDSVFGSLESEALDPAIDAGGSTGGSSNGANMTPIDFGSDDSEEDKDDFLSLLADDVSNVWK